jgi:hypothetical protein
MIRSSVFARTLAILCMAASSDIAWSAPARSDAADVLSQARELEQHGRQDSALELLKAANLAEPANPQLVLALAQAYVKSRNNPWALRVLSRYLEEHEQACNVRITLAWLQIQQGEKRQSRQLLDQSGCASPPEILARRQLYTAYLDLLEERRERATELVESARSSPVLFEEDQALLAHLTAATQPERLATVTGLVDFANGWTSHGLAGSPVDQTAQRSSGTAITIFDARLRLMAKNTGSVRPLAEGQFRAQQLWSDETSDLSFRTGTGRAGVLLGRSTPQLLMLAVVDGTQTQGGDRYAAGPMWFSEAQRGELELELPGSVYLMTGAGHRSFREIGRTRTELDGTVGWAAQQSRRLRFLGGISARYHDAKNEAFDLVGVTAVSQARFSLPKDFEAGVTASVSVDDYHRSEGYFVSNAPSTRRDAQWRAIFALYTPQFLAKMRLVARYELTARRSSASAYEYTDHRLLAALEWRIDSDQLGRSVVSTADRAAADYGLLGASGGSSSLQLRELMRQEENQRRSSTCLK